MKVKITVRESDRIAESPSNPVERALHRALLERRKNPTGVGIGFKSASFFIEDAYYYFDFPHPMADEIEEVIFGEPKLPKTFNFNFKKA